jgi:hypothetical protein
MQDQKILTGKRPGLERFEMLCQHDADAVRLRRDLAQQARLRFADLQAAGKA